jgi:hypothetical protein
LELNDETFTIEILKMFKSELFLTTFLKECVDMKKILEGKLHQQTPTNTTK